MSDFINTIDTLGDDTVMDSIIDRSITEFKDDTITALGQNAFRDCANLNTIVLPNATEIGMDAFRGCSSLAVFHAPLVTYIGVEALAFTNIKKLCFPSLVFATSQAFRSMEAVEYIDLPVCTHISNLVFYADKSLKTLILRSDTMCTLDNTNSFLSGWVGTYTPIALGNGYIYVPRALVDSYKAATNWSTYADQFRALEDYTVDGTTTGELDETKI